MKTITKKYLENEIKELEDMNMNINLAANNNPFGANVDLKQLAKDALSKLEDRVNIQIWQHHRLTVLKELLSKIK